MDLQRKSPQVTVVDNFSLALPSVPLKVAPASRLWGMGEEQADVNCVAPLVTAICLYFCNEDELKTWSKRQ